MKYWYNNIMIIAIDPGYDRCGVALVTKEYSTYTTIHSECIETKKTDSYYDRLFKIGNIIREMITRFKPNILCIEKVFFTTNQKTASNISEVRGLIFFIAREQGLDIIELTPLEVKMSLTGYGKATKDQINYMVPKLTKLDVYKKYLDDEIDAIAIGIAGFDYKHKVNIK